MKFVGKDYNVSYTAEYVVEVFKMVILTECGMGPLERGDVTHINWHVLGYTAMKRI